MHTRAVRKELPDGSPLAAHKSRERDLNFRKENSMISAKEAISRLKEGNTKYLTEKTCGGDISPAIRLRTSQNGQQPYAIVIACSDSRVIPESIFNAGIGELFTIRLAGNVIDAHQLGSIEYAVEHLRTNLVVVMGHTGCGAVDSAIHHDPSGFIKYITDEIRLAIGDETDPYRASCLNVEHSVKQISHALDIDHLRHGKDPAVIGAMYHIDDGHVEFFND